MTFPGARRSSFWKQLARVCFLCALSWAAILGQAAAPHAAGAPHVRRSQKRSHRSHRHSAAARRHPPRPQKTRPPGRPILPADAPARLAAVHLNNGQLTVAADNSDLTQILEAISRISGMQVEGLDRNARIFGVYGPGSPRDVLASLLAGSGYNFILVGDQTDGAPRRLLLSANQAGGSPAAPSTAPPVTRPEPNPVLPPPEQPAGPEISPSDASTPDDPEHTQDRASRMQRRMRMLEQMNQQQTTPDTPPQ